mmetsp:Transcript_92508/g.160714  ORF Transcript_92508/g.160714 Transcript_92508/m.160714 type:complete len:661 (-) Transcript_92508:280-2262(-)
MQGMGKQTACLQALMWMSMFGAMVAIDWTFGLSGSGFNSWAATASIRSNSDSQPGEAGTCSWVGSLWGTDEVLGWLRSLGKPFAKYTEKFEENSIDGSMLKDLTEDDLKSEFGVDNKWHIKKMLASRDQLSQQCIDVDQERESQRQEVVHQKFEEVTSVVAAGCSDSISILVAPMVWKELNKIGVQVDDHSRVVGNDFGSMLRAITDEVVRLEATEQMTNLVLHQSAIVPGGSGADASSIMAGAKADLPEIMNSKQAARGAFFDLKSGAAQLVTAIHNFKKANQEGLAEKDMTFELDLLKEEFHLWQENAGNTMQNLFLTSSALLNRTKERVRMMQAGGGAIQQNIQGLARVTSELQEASKNYKAIVDSDDSRLQMAIEARHGALSPKIQALKASIAQIEEDRAHLQKIAESKDDVIAQVEEFAIQQNKKKQEHRDWHIRWCWANLWGPEMEAYDRLADSNIAAQEVERNRAEKAKDVLRRMIAEHDEIMKKKNDELASMVVASDSWKETLEATGLLAAELAVQSKNNDLQRIEAVLQSAMQAAGVPDPAAAAEVITNSHRVNMLMSVAAMKSQDVAHLVRSWKTRFDNMIKRIAQKPATQASMRFLIGELELVGKSLLLIGEGHVQQILLLDDGKRKSAAVHNFLVAETTAQPDQKVLV